MLVRGGTVVTSSGLRAGGRRRRGRRGRRGRARPRRAAATRSTRRGLHVFPGVVDAHVHFNEPGRADWEGIATGSAALAAGGGTCFVDMPLNAHPPTVDADAFAREAGGAGARSACDFALWGGLVPGGVDRLEELAALGAIGFKAFMCPSGIDDFEAADDETLREGMERAAALGLPVAVHAESPAPLLPPARHAAGATGARAARVEAELEAIERALALAEETGCSLHVVHVSSRPRRPARRRGRARGVDATCETCPHYLFFDEDDAERARRARQVRAAAAAAAERDELWAELLGGAVDLVASDHSPAPPSMKQGDDAFAAWGGISGCQSLLPALLDRRAASTPRRSRALGRDGAGRALRPRRQGPDRAGRRRRPRARRTRRASGRSPPTTSATGTATARTSADASAAASCERSCAAARRAAVSSGRVSRRPAASRGSPCSAAPRSASRTSATRSAAPRPRRPRSSACPC